PEGGHSAARENRFAVRLQLIVHRQSAGASDARAKTETACAVRNQVRGQRAAPRKAARRISSDCSGWFSHQCVRREFQVSALADGRTKRRHFPGGYGRWPNRRAARNKRRRRAAAGSLCRRNAAALRDRLSRRLRLRRKYERAGAISLRSQNIKTAGRKRA